jgi:hypothetical protein
MGQVVAGQVVAGQVVAGQVAVVPLIYSEKVTFWDFFDFVTKCVTKQQRMPNTILSGKYICMYCDYVNQSLRLMYVKSGL